MCSLLARLLGFRDTKKHHVPLVDRSSELPPPIMVAVVGPPQVGKSTLIRWNSGLCVPNETRLLKWTNSPRVRSLVKRYTKRNVGEIKGPITVISGRYSWPRTGIPEETLLNLDPGYIW